MMTIQPKQEEIQHDGDVPLYCGNIYLYDNCWYHEKFPEEWAKNHATTTGPIECLNCRDYGCINGIFIGYCVNCAIFAYEGERGRGFESSGCECEDEDVLVYPSAFDTYLLGVDTDLIEPVTERDFEQEQEPDTSNPEYNENDYLNADPYEDTYSDGLDVSVMVCDFEGGYNDF